MFIKRVIKDFSEYKILTSVTILLLLPLFILGKASFLLMHDNGDSVLPSIIAAARYSNFFHYFYPFQGLGVASNAQPTMFGYQLLFFKYLPGWLGFQLIIISHIIVSTLCMSVILNRLNPNHNKINLGFSVFYSFHISFYGMMVYLCNLLLPGVLLLVLYLQQKMSKVTTLCLTIFIGYIFSQTSTNFYFITLYMLFAASIIYACVDNKAYAILIIGCFLFGNFLGVWEYLFSAYVNSIGSHRPPRKIILTDHISKIFENKINLILFIISSSCFFIKRKSQYVKKLLFCYSVMWLLYFSPVFLHFLKLLTFLKFDFKRILFPIIGLSFPLSAVSIAYYTEYFAKSRLSRFFKYGLYFGPLLILWHGATYYYSAMHGMIMGGNYFAYEVPELKKIADSKDHMLGDFRVETLNWGLGDGFLPVYGLESAGGYLTIYPKRYMELFSLILSGENAEGLSNSATKYKSWGNRLNLTCGEKDYIKTKGFNLKQCVNVNLLSLLNVKYIVSRNPILHKLLKPVKEQRTSFRSLTTTQKIKQSISELFGGPFHIFVYENQHTTPRVFIPKNIILLDNKEQGFKKLSNSSIEVLEENVLVEKNDLKGEFNEYTNISGKIIDLKYGKDRINILVQMSKPGIVVISNSFHANWLLKINHMPASVIPVYHSLLGIKVKSGLQHIELTYSDSHSLSNRLFGFLNYDPSR